jgi:F0F1-type ATP synthase membrane subunit c/vacuolar-type H+-ATPase subunit K
VAVGFVAQSPEVTWSVLAAGVAATLAGVGTSYAQRRLSTPARELRSRTAEVSGTVTRADGHVEPLDRATLLTPLEGALRALSWAVPVVALAALLARV